MINLILCCVYNRIRIKWYPNKIEERSILSFFHPQRPNLFIVFQDRQFCVFVTVSEFVAKDRSISYVA